LRIVNRAWKAFIIGGAFVGIVKVLGHYGMATPVPFLLLIAGIAAGAFVPDSGFSFEGDVHPWGPVSAFVFYAVNIAIYSGLAWLILYRVRRPSRASK
jgi:hypothetical protein